MRSISYEIVSGNNLKELKENVKRLMLEGWIPQGGISLAFDEEGMLFVIQAMIYKQ